MKTREQKKKAEVAKRIHGIVHGNDKNKRTIHAQDEMGKRMHHDDQELFSIWRGGGVRMTTQAGGLTLSCAPRQRREYVEYIRRQNMYTRVPREVCLREREGHPSRQDGRRLTRGNQGSPTCARGGSRRNTRHTQRRELYASTPLLEALKVVLSEIATAERGGKVVALVAVRRVYLCSPARRRVFVEPARGLPGR